MNKTELFKSAYIYLYKRGVYDKAKVASFVGKTIDAAAYKEITGDDYVDQIETAN
ncbi:XkdX family protein [Lactobacillus sp. ESL0263]|uniref:XkdX family protein n=1 Tax=Lactobacillus sp. ESL0263 TaxID=2069350 RepID=UPI000EFCD076|nr:XkdX family protein [Lactobacillus sp. ESL0263]RMC50142.1 XkdX family protein [Lactobacillus sp. ESL0263]